MTKIVSFFLKGILIASLTICSSYAEQQSKDSMLSQDNISESKDNISENMQIRIKGEKEQDIVFQLNDSPAAKAFYNQLPLSILIDNYSNNEKIFYPPNELDISNTPMAEGAAGTLAYYAPWSDIAIYYGECRKASGLYELGQAISGIDQIENLSGEIQIEAVTKN